jgi:hypothetical protein
MLRRIPFALVLPIATMAAVAALVAAPAHAERSSAITTGIGPRVGFSSGPDQLVVGGQMVIGEVAPSLTFDPSVEIGIGDHQTLLGVNFDMHYHFETSSVWRPYVGLGATVNEVNYDNDEFGDRESDTFAGGNLIVGAGAPTRSGSRFFAELKLGLGDVPDLKIMVGWNFRM